MTAPVSATAVFNPDKVIPRVVLKDGKNPVQLMLAKDKDARQLLGKVAAGIVGDFLILIVLPGHIQHSTALADELRTLKSSGAIPARWELSWFGGANFRVDTSVMPYNPCWENSSTTLGKGLTDEIMAIADRVVSRLFAEACPCPAAP